MAILVAPPAARPCASCLSNARRLAEVVAAAKEEVEAERRARKAANKEAAEHRRLRREAEARVADLEKRCAGLLGQLREAVDLLDRQERRLDAREAVIDGLLGRATAAIPPDRRS